VAEEDFKNHASPAGLCATCRHARRIRSASGSTFTFCELSRRDERYPKYPRLPVRSCEGWADAASSDPPAAPHPEIAGSDKNASPPLERAEPVQETDRIAAIDVLRGFAVLGILAVNIQSFAMPDAALFNPTAYGDLTGANRWVWYITHVLFEQKFMTIFSMLFGAGILLMTGRMEAKGMRSAPLHYRRMAVLLCFGLLHAYLLWTGDILVSYAMCGILAYFFRHREPRSLAVWGIGFVAVASVLGLLFAWSMPYWPAESVEELERSLAPSSEVIAETLAASRGGYLSELSYRAPHSLQSQTFVFLIWTLWRAGGLMLIGMALFKQGVFSAARSSRFYVGLVIAAAAAGIPAVIYGSWRNFEAGWDFRYTFFVGSQYNYWASILVSLGWAALAMLACKHGAARVFTSRLAAVGRMAFSNYLAQSLICTTIFYGRGLGLFGSVDRVTQALIVIGVWIVQLALSPWWLARFRFGPCEWVWRSLTYGKRQPMGRT
jgi:uncharacterized protein